MARINPLSGNIWVRGVLEHPAFKKPFKVSELMHNSKWFHLNEIASNIIMFNRLKSRMKIRLIDHIQLSFFFSQPNALTYACFGFIAVYFAYQIPRIYYHCSDPGRIASDALKYDRKSKKYVE